MTLFSIGATSALKRLIRRGDRGAPWATSRVITRLSAVSEVRTTSPVFLLIVILMLVTRRPRLEPLVTSRGSSFGSSSLQL